MVKERFAIQLTKPKAEGDTTWIRVSKDTGLIYVNVGHHGRFYADLSKNVIHVTKSTVGSYKVSATPVHGKRNKGSSWVLLSPRPTISL